MDPATLFTLKALAKLYGGLVKSRAQRRQAQNMASMADIQGNFVKSNLYADAGEGFGSALLASNRAGGFDPSALSGGFSNLASDLRTAQFNLAQGSATSAARKSASRMSLIGSIMDAGLDYSTGTREDKLMKKLTRQSLLTLGDGPL
jgi:hypothetical protein